MRAIQLEESFGIENLKLRELAMPEAGPGQVRVRVRAAALNYRDLLMVRGHYDRRQPLPLVPLSDGVGHIDSLGSGVTGLQVGQRVAGLFAPRWQGGAPDNEVIRITRGGPLPGMLAEYVVLDASGVIAVPEYLSDVEAATLPCAGLTAWSALVTHAGIGSGDTVLVLGSGGVSSFAIDFACMHGARVIATTSSPAKQAYLEQRGAWQTINYKETPRWSKRVRELTDGRGADVVVEVGGAGTLGESLYSTRVGGTVALIGVLAGAKAEVNLLPVLMNQLRVQGVFVGSREGFEGMNRALEQHELRPHIDRVFELEAAQDAFSYLGQAGHCGKVCISLGTPAGQ